MEILLVAEDDFLNFSLEDPKPISKAFSKSPSSIESSNWTTPFPEGVEEELEWLSNKDAFPEVETCFGILSDNPELILNHQDHCPISELDNSSYNNTNSNSKHSRVAVYFSSSLQVPTNFPSRARSKRRRGRRLCFSEFPSQQWLWESQQLNIKNKQEPLFHSRALSTSTTRGASMGRRCLHCQSDKTPQWRAGPMGPKTLCNACGVRYKSGRLVPEYRPANSPTFCSVLHSNSHRKVVEMRKKKEMGIMVNEGYGLI